MQLSTIYVRFLLNFDSKKFGYLCKKQFLNGVDM